MALNDLMNRYNPRVPSSRYRLIFVPVVEDGREEGRDRGEVVRERERGGGRRGREGEEVSGVVLGGLEGETGGGCRERSKGHLLRTTRYCWCDRETKMMMKQVHMLDEGGRERENVRKRGGGGGGRYIYR